MKLINKRIVGSLLALVMLIGMLPMTAFAEETEVTELVAPGQIIDTDRLYNPIVVNKGALATNYDGSIIDSDIYGYVVNYPLKKGHVLSISDTNYVFSVRKWENGNYSTMLKQATTANYTATEDVTVAMLIRKPDKSAVTAEELASIVICDSQFGMIGVEGSVKRFTVEAETIDGGTATTRAAIFLPESYSESGEPTRLVVMTNGYSAHLTDSVWNKNSAENVQVIQNYLNADYAVWVVDNTAASTSQTPDLGCPQLVDSYWKAYEYIQNNLNVEQKFSVHARSFGTFAAVRIMREHPELVKCAVMTGSRVSIQAEWPGIKKAHVANRFGFTDTTGATYEADKLVGYDPYTDVNDATYTLPPTFWMLAEGDSTAKPCEFIETLTAHGNDATLKIYSDISHTGICTLNTGETFSDALAYLEKYQTEAHTHTYENGVCTGCGETRGIEYEINSISVLDSAYQPLSAIPDGAFYAQVSVANLSSVSMDTLILAAYNEQGRMLNLYYLTANPQIGQTFILGTYINNSGGEIASLKAFMMPKLGGAAVPLAESVTFPSRGGNN